MIILKKLNELIVWTVTTERLCTHNLHVIEKYSKRTQITQIIMIFADKINAKID